MVKYRPPEQNNIDPDALRIIEDFHINNPNITVPHPTIDLNRLSVDSPLISPITCTDTLAVINNFKNKAPGIDQIKKVHLTKVPPHSHPGNHRHSELCAFSRSLPGEFQKRCHDLYW